MSGETNLEKLLKKMTPELNAGSYVFCTVPEESQVDVSNAVLFFRETEGITLILRKEIADNLKLNYSFIASWITLTVHSSLEAVGLTAAFSKALTQENISCNVVSGYYHDHIFVDTKDAQRAMNVLHSFSDT